jgi:ribosomal protein L21E
MPKLWDILLPSVVYTYGTKIHTSIRRSPFEILYGTKPVEPDPITESGCELAELDQSCEEIRGSVTEALEDARRLMVKLLKGKSCCYEFNVGDYVLVKRKTPKKHKFQEKWEGPFLVVERHAKNAYRISDPNGKKKFKALVNTSQLKPFRFRGSM